MLEQEQERQRAAQPIRIRLMGGVRSSSDPANGRCAQQQRSKWQRTRPLCAGDSRRAHFILFPRFSLLHVGFG